MTPIEIAAIGFWGAIGVGLGVLAVLLIWALLGMLLSLFF